MAEDGDDTTVVLTIGTAIGSGFPPRPDRLLRLADGFAVEIPEG
jgi:hypothetical protein